MNYIFVDVKEKCKTIGLVEEDQLLEIYIDNENTSDIGSIYRGRVESVVKGINAAFVDIGYKKNAYLRFKDIKSKDDELIQEVIEGREIIVQVKKDGTEIKGAQVTSKLEISGSHMVLTPYVDKVMISRKINDKSSFIRLKVLGQKIKKNNCGIILRTSSKDINDEDLENEYLKLLNQFEAIKREKNFLPCPKLLYAPITDWQETIIRRIGDIDRVIVNDKAEFESLKHLVCEKNESLLEKISLEDYDYRYDENVHSYLTEALKRKIYLKSGGSIIIDELEALTAIDINTEGIKADKSFRKNILKTNIESAKKIAEQIRLRNISGIIIIDFINMDSDEDREKVREEIKINLERDNIQSNVYGFTALGLLEVSRMKKRNSLKNIIENRSL